MKRVFKYYPEDFKETTIDVVHMDLDFDIYDDHTKVVSHLRGRTRKEIKELSLNAKNLEIVSVSSSVGEVTFDYKKDMLLIRFPETIPADKEFSIMTETICRPTKHILEGLYFDVTPSEAPPQQITQCQQWGFQRIVPCIDAMTAKCTYTTRITADSKYTNLITNGDIIEERHSIGEGRDTIVYDNSITPMAPYVFFLGVGTYATFTKEFEYPDGGKFMLELLVPPDSDKKRAENALQVLYDSIMWIYLFTGPDTYKNHPTSLEIKKLVERRDNGEDVQDEITSKIKGMTLGYKYTGTVYREIGMQNADCGGMENVGNTTITTNRIMPFAEMTDSSFEYMIDVKVHEFYHNLNGSEVTGWSPFELWLNEAVTVVIEKQYHAFLFGEDYSRLDVVLGIMSPFGGTLSEDDSALSMPIEPDGFNTPDELITGVTYSKAPEFIRMITLLMGKEKFVEALDVYHRRYKHGNATRAQWLACMEEVSGMDFKKMAQMWLKQLKYPNVHVVRSYHEKKLTLKLTQSGHWEFPFAVALVDENGEDIAEKTEWIKNPQQEIVFENVEPSFISLNRGYSFFGKVDFDAGDEELYLQVRKDKDMVNRYVAFSKIANKVKERLLRKEEVDEQFIDLYFELLDDKDLMQNACTGMLAIFEHVDDPEFEYCYQELYDVKKELLTRIARKYEKEIRKLYAEHSHEKTDGSYMENQVANIKQRQVKNTCLGLLAKLDTPEIHSLIKKQFDSAKCATDRYVAFSNYINSSAPDKIAFLEAYEKVARENLVSWEAFLGMISGNDSSDALDIMKRVQESEYFKIEQTNDQRALYGRFALNKKKSLLTEEGRGFMKNALIKLCPVNEYTAMHILSVYGIIDKLKEEYHVPLVKMLVEVLSTLDKDKQASAYNNIRRILLGNTKSVSAYEKAFGKIE
ncbi:M1 family metallopeptidase [Candidatus Woesearchaeota archaeon]|nr:M1 family metallopeptidase [Candidatus Woesearchaeota archaeon]